MRLLTTALLGILATGPGVQAQSPGNGEPVGPAPAHSVRAVVQRWLDVQAATVLARYRHVVSSTGTLVANHMQDSFLLRPRVKFDAKGRYALSATLQTGNNFTASWNNVGWGTGGPRTTGVYLKHLYFSAAPIAGLDVSYGGLGFVRGESSEITTYDNDGYMLGGRVTIRRPDDLFLDEISATEGYFGDPANPGISDRISKIGTVNYFDVVGVKKVGKLVGLSGDYTYQDHAVTLRAAALVRTPHARVIDSVRYEHYCRVRRLPACGFAGTVDKTLTARLNVSGGYADVDPDFGGVNGDRYTRGRRVFEQVSVRVVRDVTVSAFATQAFDDSFVVVNARRVDLIVSYNALGPLQRAGLFR